MDSKLGKVVIIGVGLIGGSIGAAIRSRRLAREVVGVGRSARRLARARQCAAVDSTSTSLDQAVRGAELIIICTPVSTIADFAADAAQACPDTALITDAGSTKVQVVSAVAERLRANRMGRDSASTTRSEFLGSHPIAGDHRTGVEHARADLFVDRNVVITPTPRSSAEAKHRLTAFWESLGATVHVMTPLRHDQALAASSHLPHLVAAALAAATPPSALPLTAGGWQDTTRIAAGDPGLWCDIFATNSEPLLAALDRFERTMAGLRKAIQTGNVPQIEKLLTKAKRIRDAV